MEKVSIFLMFQDGNAETAMNFYTSIIEDSQITSLVRYGANEAGKEGTVMHTTFTLKGQQFMCIDSSVKHQFSFTPSISIFVTCDNEEELDHLYEELNEGGKVLMPLSNYG